MNIKEAMEKLQPGTVIYRKEYDGNIYMHYLVPVMSSGKVGCPHWERQKMIVPKDFDHNQFNRLHSMSFSLNEAEDTNWWSI